MQRDLKTRILSSRNPVEWDYTMPFNMGVVLGAGDRRDHEAAEVRVGLVVVELRYSDVVVRELSVRSFELGREGTLQVFNRDVLLCERVGPGKIGLLLRLFRSSYPLIPSFCKNIRDRNGHAGVGLTIKCPKHSASRVGRT